LDAGAFRGGRGRGRWLRALRGERGDDERCSKDERECRNQASHVYLTEKFGLKVQIRRVPPGATNSSWRVAGYAIGAETVSCIIGAVPFTKARVASAAPAVLTSSVAAIEIQTRLRRG